MKLLLTSPHRLYFNMRVKAEEKGGENRQRLFFEMIYVKPVS